MGRTKGKVAKATGELILQAKEILEEYKPNAMTLRQVFYQLVSRGFVSNTKAEYSRLSIALTKARQNGTIPWDWMEDRTRQPRTVSMWGGIEEFGQSVVSQYRLDVWENQPTYTEVWLEKDALSGIFQDVLDPYGVTLNVGKGYDGWASIKNAAKRYKNANKPVTILYFGDFDPSGEDMNNSLEKRLNYFKDSKQFGGFEFKIEKIAILKSDIEDYDLPPNLTKRGTANTRGDPRADKFVAEHGDASVELDALPIDVLKGRIETCLSECMDLDELDTLREIEMSHKVVLEKIFNEAARA